MRLSQNKEPRDEECKCVDCQNPLNGIGVSKLSVCALHHIHRDKDLTEEDLNDCYEFAVQM